MRAFIFIALLFFTGCQNIEIKTTRSWEGHYFTVDDFKTNTNNIILNEDESIWVISDDTLEHILKSR